MQVRLTTTGTQSPVAFEDLNGRAFTHPTANYNLLIEFSQEQLWRSVSLQTAIDAGHITLTDENSIAITNVANQLGGVSTTQSNAPLWNASAIQGAQVNVGTQAEGRWLRYAGAQLVYQDMGPQGPQGFYGQQGFVGSQGAQGWQGLAGTNGNQGPQGWQGLVGTGTQGNQGWQGLAGSQGNQGWQGSGGPQGNQGWQGTGVQGPQGNQGRQGFQDAQGRQGFQGWQGNLGPQGNQGWQGLAGYQGNQGNQGNQGRQGWQGGVGYDQATAVDSPTSNSATDVLITGMTLTPAAGTYKVLFTSSYSSSLSNGIGYMSIWSGGSQIAASEVRTSMFKLGDITPFCCIGIATVNGSQAIEGRGRVSGGTGTYYQRTLLILKVG